MFLGIKIYCVSQKALAFIIGMFLEFYDDLDLYNLPKPQRASYVKNIARGGQRVISLNCHAIGG